MKWLFVFMVLLLAGSVYAEVETVSSGVFRGSMRHVVTISAEDVVSNVAPGDYLSFRFADGEYLTKSNAEELDVYIRRFDAREQTMNFDVGSEKFLEIAVGEEYALDVDFDGVDDVVLAFDSLDRRGEFILRDINAVPEEDIPDNLLCEVACYSSDDCLPAEQCVFPGTCDAKCEVDERINPPAPELINPPSMEIEVTPEETEKGWFTRVLEWFARLF